jgi:hypothetical protein
MKWISVKDKLPDIRKKVVCYMESIDEMDFGHLEYMDEKKPVWNWGAMTRNISHWMPMPPKPKKG